MLVPGLGRPLLLAVPLLALMVLSLGAEERRRAQGNEVPGTPRAYLGIQVRGARPGPGQEGVTVESTDADSPAARAGLKTGDRIVRVGDRAVRDFEDLLVALSQHKPGEAVVFQVQRDGQKQDLNVRLGERPGLRPGTAVPGPRATALLGVQALPLTPEQRERLKVGDEGGVLVAGVMRGTPAARAGLRPGDVIASADGKRVGSPEELREAVSRAGVGKTLTLSVLRDGDKKEVKATLEEAPVEGFGLFPPIPPGIPGVRELAPPLPGAAERNAELERRVKELEKRVRELENQRGTPEKKD